MTTIHRLLDEAFAGIPLSPEVQDLKEEVRANLLARIGIQGASGPIAGRLTASLASFL